jgi:NADH-quinone oxidoreductase subunit J
MLLLSGAFTVIASLMVIFARNTVHSALWMVASFFFMAVLYLLQRAEFIAILQIIVYAGAIMMFIIYAIMMLNLRLEKDDRKPTRGTKLFGLGLLAVLFLALLTLGVGRGIMAMKGNVTEQMMEKYGNVEVLSNFLFSSYLLPFEVVSILLTAGVVGSVALARRKQSTRDKQ